jgi:hypothetical protein
MNGSCGNHVPQGQRKQKVTCGYSAPTTTTTATTTTATTTTTTTTTTLMTLLMPDALCAVDLYRSQDCSGVSAQLLLKTGADAYFDLAAVEQDSGLILSYRDAVVAIHSPP